MSLKRAVIAAAILAPGRSRRRERRRATDNPAPTACSSTARSSSPPSAAGCAGAISVRFEDTHDGPVLQDPTTASMPSKAPGQLRDPRERHGVLGVPVVSATPFFQTSAPAVTGDGSLANPWNVTSGFETRALGVTQQVRHVDGSRSLRLTWTVTNSTNLTIPFKAFWNADLYVSGSDEGTGALLAGPPRTLQGIADRRHQGEPDRADAVVALLRGRLRPRPPIPRSMPAPRTTTRSTRPRVDNGFGVQWNRTLAPHASTTSCSASAPPSRAAIPCPPWRPTSPRARSAGRRTRRRSASMRTPATPPPSGTSAASTAASSTCAPRRRPHRPRAR